MTLARSTLDRVSSIQSRCAVWSTRSALEKLVVRSVAEVRRRYGLDDGAWQFIQADAASWRVLTRR